MLSMQPPLSRRCLTKALTVSLCAGSLKYLRHCSAAQPEMPPRLQETQERCAAFLFDSLHHRFCSAPGWSLHNGKQLNNNQAYASAAAELCC